MTAAERHAEWLTLQRLEFARWRYTHGLLTEGTPTVLDMPRLSASPLPPYHPAEDPSTYGECPC